MTAIAIVGAGPGLGLSIARLFGEHGFDVALIARDKARLDRLVAGLEDAGIAAAGFPADVLDRLSLVSALGQAGQRRTWPSAPG